MHNVIQYVWILMFVVDGSYENSTETRYTNV